MPTIPDAIRARYGLTQPNRSVRLYSGQMIVSAGTYTGSARGSLDLSWLPSPSIQFSTPSGPPVWTEVTVSTRGAIAPAHGMVTHADLGPGGGPMGGFLAEQLRRGRGDHLSCLVFHIANFHSFVGTPVLYPGGARPSRVSLVANGWRIDLDCVADIDGVMARLKADGGYALTHVGRLVREDGAAFAIADGQAVLETLGLLLSFAAGASVHPFLLVGMDRRDRVVYRSYERPVVARWQDRLCWFDRFDPAGLSRVWPGLVAKRSDPQLGELADRAIYMLNEANRGGVEPGVVVAQTVLELLAWQMLVNEAHALSRGGFDGLHAHDQLRLLLTICSIPLGVPTALGALAAFATSASVDGPEALTRIRNRWVHPPRKLPVGRDAANLRIQAAQLALWYCDLVLLRWLGFSGPYVPRVSPGRSVPVPWP